MSTLKVNNITNLAGVPFEGGGGGGSGSGADAWADVAADGTLEGSLNIASLTRISAGVYDVTFATTMPSANYAVTCSTAGVSRIRYVNQTAQGFNIVTTDPQTTNNPIDAPFSFAVFATNALPPKGGTGADHWCTTQGFGFNVASVTQVGGSQGNNWNVVFETPMPSDDYAVVATPITTGEGFCFIRNRTSTGYTVVTRDDDGSVRALSWAAVVHATNATLPQTVTQEQIDAAINNPGLSAWGLYNGTDTLLAGNNISSVVKTATGKYTVTFTTPMPSNRYSVAGSVWNVAPASAYTFQIEDLRNDGFDLSTTADTGSGVAFSDQAFAFQVAATNALPPKGGTGADAWASCTPSGIQASFNFGAFNKNNIGSYTLTFSTPMPTSDYSVVAASSSTSGRVVNIVNKTTTGFDVVSRAISTDTLTDGSFNVVVNATNATLPTTFTEEQIQGVIDANPEGIAKAWVKFDGITNNILNSFGISSMQDNGRGSYTVFFANNFSSANYCAYVSNIRQNTLSIENYAEVSSINDPQPDRCTILSTVATTSSGIPALDTVVYAVFFDS